ncbi:hypothetical protein [Cellulomonas sp. Y8]|uniref:hypothetical protein n=1 Tax=Cellulomonas sp. Y8 TaxID=2591145 RepID=UPI00143D0328|nr:hypothetical protein [Cellulomonas sp. Y8]
MNSFKNWVIGTSLLCAVVLGLGAFLLVKPQLDEAGELDAQTEALVASNDDLAGEVADLKEQFSHIDEYRTALASAQTRVPQRADISAMLREIDAIATASGVTLVSSSPGAAQEWIAPEPETPAADDAAADGESEGDAPSPDEATAEEQAAADERWRRPRRRAVTRSPTRSRARSSRTSWTWTGSTRCRSRSTWWARTRTCGRSSTSCSAARSATSSPAT